jgi:poly-gamma-glutamate capsule biosynthesis protein CapA/YwtB (metallophosphatase superfamily)
MTYKHVVRLSAEERTRLERLVATGRNSAATLLHARILLKADANHTNCNWEDVRITVALDTSISTVLRVRKAFVEQGLDAALYRKRSTRHYQRRLDGAGEAKLIALACSQAPEGRARWIMQLLADKLIELKIVDSISDDTVHRTLKKTTSSPG